MHSLAIEHQSPRGAYGACMAVAGSCWQNSWPPRPLQLLVVLSWLPPAVMTALPPCVHSNCSSYFPAACLSCEPLICHAMPSLSLLSPLSCCHNHVPCPPCRNPQPQLPAQGPHLALLHLPPPLGATAGTSISAAPRAHAAASAVGADHAPGPALSSAHATPVKRCAACAAACQCQQQPAAAAAAGTSHSRCAACRCRRGICCRAWRAGSGGR